MAQEEVLERRRRPRDVDDVEPGQRAQHVADARGVDPEGDLLTVDAQVVHPAGRGEPGEPTGAVHPAAAGAQGDRRAGEVAQLGEVAGLDHPAVADDRHGVAQPFHLAEDVAAQQHGGTPLAQRLHLVAEDGLHQRVEPGRRLVEEEQLGVRRQRGHQRDLLPVALGVGAHLGGRVEVEPLDEPLLPRGVDRTVHPGEEVECLPAREGRPQRDVAGHVGHAGVQLHGIPPRVQTQHPCRTLIGADEAEERADRRRLARSVGAEEPAHLPGVDDQVQTVERDGRAEGLGQLPDLDGRCTHGEHLRGPPILPLCRAPDAGRGAAHVVSGRG